MTTADDRPSGRRAGLADGPDVDEPRRTLPGADRS
jgi:hypothetical protein